MPSDVGSEEVGDRTLKLSSSQKPLDSQPAATLPMYVFEGLLIQNVLGLLLSVSKERTMNLTALVLAPKLPVNVLSNSPPSSSI